MAQTPTTIGSVKVNIYAGLPGADPQEVGVVTIPLRLDTMREKGIESSLKDAVEITALHLNGVFGQDVPEGQEFVIDDEMSAAWADYRKDYGVPEKDFKAAHKAFIAGYHAAQAGPQDGALR